MHFVRLNKCHLAALSRHSLRLCGESFSGCASPQRRRERRGGAEKKLLAAIGLFLVLAATTPAQRKHAEPLRAIPSPLSVFGFNPGDDRTIADWKQITNYFARLDQASDRVTVQTIGQSTLGRPLIAAFISAPENTKPGKVQRDPGASGRSAPGFRRHRARSIS